MPRDESRPGSSPLEEPRARGGAPKPKQPWPGREGALRSQADHGEESYRGSGKLEGRVALVTGGDSGIGRAIAIAYAREGADVAIAYFDEHGDASETVRWVEKAGRRGLALAGDLTDRDHCVAVVEQVVQRFGRLDILVNNAAVHFDTTLETLDPAQLERVFRTNVFAPLWLIQAALRHLPEGGVVLNTGSVAGLQGNASLPDYAATKAALHNLTRSLAQGLAGRGIRVNCVAPGPVWTPLVPATRAPDQVEGFGGQNLWHRPAQPAEIAPSYVFLASAEARFYTGEILAPTGMPATTR
jgi:NAD(P)-dependent dehydrogenase (short-subunit alcohol dehydrogenase family)